MALSDTREGRYLASLLDSFDADVARLREAMAAMDEKETASEDEED